MKKMLNSCMKFSSSKEDDDQDDLVHPSSFMRSIIRSMKPSTSGGPSESEPKSDETSPTNVLTRYTIQTATLGWHRDCYLGMGRTCRVYRNTLDHDEIVAFKRLFNQPSLKQQHYREFKAEQEFLAKLHHENIVQLRDSCTDKNEMILVLEYVPNGTLFDRLQGTKKKLLGWETRMKIALGAARAISYIHQAVPGPVIHRDIKSTHILVDERENAKLIDFGNAILEPEDKHCSHIVGTEPYTAPEYKRANKLSTYCDIHSFGVVLLEIVTGRKPIGEGEAITAWVSKQLVLTADWDSVVPRMFDEKIRPTVPPQDMMKIMKLATDCIRGNFLERPDAAQIVSRLLEISCLTHSAPSSSGGAIGGEVKGKSTLDPITE